MILAETKHKPELTALLASHAVEKIDASVGGMQKAVPLKADGRRFVVVADSKEVPGDIYICEQLERQGDPPLSAPTVLYRGPALPQDQVQEIVGNTDLLLYAKDSESFVRPQPLVELRVRKVEEGFQGAVNRVDFIRKQDQQAPVPIDPDIYIGAENALVHSQMTVPGRKEVKKAITDTGFVYVEGRDGDWEVAHSGGIVFGDKHGLDYHEMSERTGFEKPAGHFFSPERSQNPHAKATGGLYPREDWLIPPIATAIHQLRSRGTKGKTK